MICEEGRIILARFMVAAFMYVIGRGKLRHLYKIKEQFGRHKETCFFCEWTK